MPIKSSLMSRLNLTLKEGQVIAIDGKTLRSPYNREDRVSIIHMISAYALLNKLVLGQLNIEQKSNEITAIPELIKMLDIKGALVDIDAIACQTKIAKVITDKGGDYLLAVKSNQGKLRKAVEKSFSKELEICQILLRLKKLIDASSHVSVMCLGARNLWATSLVG